MKKRIIKTSVSVILSLAMLFGGVPVVVAGTVTPSSAAKKSAPVYLAKKKFSLTIKQNADKITYTSAKIKVKKKKGVKIKKITYDSGDIFVVNVDNKGRIKGSGSGTARVEADVKYTYKNKTRTKKLFCDVSVKCIYKNIFKDLKLKHKVYATYVGNSEGVCPCYKSDVELDSTFFAWDCLKMDVKDNSIIEQGKNGYILGKKVGETTVTVRSTDGSGLSDTATVKVYATAADMPPQDDLYESEKSEFIKQLEGHWTEEDKKQIVDDEGHLKWDFLTEANLIYTNNMLEINKDLEERRVADHPDGSAIDAVYSFFTTGMDVNLNGEDDAVFFDTLKEKIVKPIMDSKDTSELKSVCASLSHEGIYPLIRTDGFELYQENQDVINAIRDGMDTATEEPQSTKTIGFAKVNADCLSELMYIEEKDRDKITNKYIKNVLSYMGITDKTFVKTTQKFIVECRKKNTFSDYYKLSKLDKKYPNIELRTWLIDKDEYNINDDSTISFGGKTMMKELDKALSSEKNLTALKGYAVVSAVVDLMPYTKKGLRTSIETYLPYMFEDKNEKEKDKAVENQLYENIHDAVYSIKWDWDQVYTDRFYSKNYKKDFEKLVDRFVETYREAIQTSEMSKTAKESMLKKLDKMHHNCLYPTDEEYKKLRFQGDMSSPDEGGKFADNLLMLQAYRAYMDRLAVGNVYGSINWYFPSEIGESSLTPWSINAFFNSQVNQTMFCHACMAPIFEDNPSKSEKIDVKNIGFMATTIGHEIGHAFDPDGNNFNEKGEIQKCWETTDEALFQAKMEKIVDFYGAYAAFISDIDKTALYQQGEKVVGEAASDLGGMEIGLKLLKKTYPNDDEYIRQFFIDSARQWADTRYDHMLAGDLEPNLGDEHPQSRARANIVSPVEEFYRVFDVKETDAMYVAPEDRVELWKSAA